MPETMGCQLMSEISAVYPMRDCGDVLQDINMTIRPYTIDVQVKYARTRNEHCTLEYNTYIF